MKVSTLAQFNSIKISIITVVYNDLAGIEETIKSVHNQDYANIEYIVIDGNSSDGTKELIEENSGLIDHYISEKDKGLYDAMNKGLALATGDFCMFLNSGDVLYERQTISTYVDNIADLNKVFFGVAVMTDRKTIYRLRPPQDIEISKWISSGNLPNHQAMLFPKSFYQENKYDLSLKYNADDDYKIRALHKHSYEFIPFWSIMFNLEGVSRSLSSFKLMRQRNKDLLALYHKQKDKWQISPISIFKFIIKSFFLVLTYKLIRNKILLELNFNKFKRIKKEEQNKFVTEINIR